MNLKKKKVFLPAIESWPSLLFQKTNRPSLFQRPLPCLLYMFCPGSLWACRCILFKNTQLKREWAEIGGTLYSPILLLGRSAPTWRKLLLFRFCTKVPCEPSLPLILAFGGGFCSISCLTFVIRSFSSASKYALVWKPQQKFWVFLAFYYVPSPFPSPIHLRVHAHMLKSEIIFKNIKIYLLIRLSR